jgi:pimeloyl-ACP methyl ester carboxylesterase
VLVICGILAPCSVSPVPTVPVDGSELHVERRGDGEPLLLIQGMGAHSAHWGEPFLRELERDFEIVLYDHRGIGRSGPCNGDITTADLAADALALLHALGIERAHVLGFSMGGMVAQELALSAPQRVATLVLVGTTAGGTQSKPTSGDVVQALTAAVLSGDRERVLRTGFGLVVSAPYADSAEHYAAFAAVAREHPASIQMLMEQQAAIVAHDSYGRLRGLAPPTLVIHGSEDRMLSPINGDLLASLISGARLEQLAGAGHLVYWERPERTAQLVREHAAAHAT